MSRPASDPATDRLARALARHAGQRWDELANYPGYAKNQWREQADALLRELER